MKNKSNQTGEYWWAMGLNLFLRLSGWIVAPILAAVFIGKKLDSKYGTGPWLFLSVMGIAFVVSIFGIILNTLKEFKKIDSETRKNDQYKTEEKK